MIKILALYAGQFVVKEAIDLFLHGKKTSIFTINLNFNYNNQQKEQKEQEDDFDIIDDSKQELITMFNEWKTKNNRNFSDQENPKKLEHFVQNLRYMQENNLENMQIEQYLDLSPENFKTSVN